MGKVQIGQTIHDRYRIQKSLGRGGMAEVFLAEDIRLSRHVALKVIRMDEIPQSMHEEVHKRFEREPRALARMQHPNIVSIHDFGFVGDEPFFVMDFIAGGSFDKLIKARLGYQEVARLLAPIADALAYAHDRKILHRDVKPSNMLLTEHRQPVLMDFGIAKVVSQETQTSLTQAGMSVGTPGYMAPEQWRGQVYSQTDGYALGIVFYQMLTGEVPYHDDITMNIALKHMNEPVPQLCKSRPDLPSDIDLFLRKALAKNSKDRFVDMHQYRDALKVLSQGGSLLSFLGDDATELAVNTPMKNRKYTEAETEAPKPKPQVRQQRPVPRPQPQSQLKPTPKPQPQKQYVAPNPTPTPQQFPDGYYRTTPPSSPAVKKKKRFPLWGWVLVALGLLAGLAVIIIASVLGSMMGNRATPTAAVSVIEASMTEEVSENNDSAPTATSVPVENSAGQEETPSIFPTYTDLPTQTPFSSSSYGIGDSLVWEKDGAVMWFVPAGTFIQGSESSVDPDTYTVNEGPMHEVYLDAFWIDETEVTNAQFSQFAAATGHVTSAEQIGSSKIMNDEYNWDTVNGMDWRHPDGTSYSYDDNKPVVHVSWIDANAYCKWAGKRLPTESEWEKAARGPEGNKYPWGNNNATASLANFGDPEGTVRIVGSYANGISYYGLFDMAGNVWEVVSDYYERDYYLTSPNTNPQGPSSADFYVAKGGSYGFDATVIRSAVRVRRGPSQTFADMGFRCAADH